MVKQCFYIHGFMEKKKRLTRNCALHLYSGSFICLPVQSMHHQ